MSTDMGFEPVESGSYYFISYSTEDKEIVSKYLLRMLKDKLPMWYDRGIEYGTNFESEISKHISYCEAVLLFMSNTPFKKEDAFVRKEFNIAKRRGKPIHVIYIEQIIENDVPVEYDVWWEELRRIQGILAHRQDMENTVSELYSAIKFSPSKSENDNYSANASNGRKNESGARRKASADKRYSPLPATGYKYYMGGQPYSDDPKILITTVNGMRVKKLKEALRDIFYHWNTDQVFVNSDGSELKEDFIKLIRTACRDSNINGDNIEEILSHNVDTDPTRNKNCKFFRLFYEEIFQGKDRPKEFYWSNNLSLARLTPLFKDVGDFSDKFSDQSSVGDNVRRIFRTHTKEICSFLEIDNESRLLENIMISSVERHGEVIWLENSGDPPVKLGSVNGFIKKMKTFTDLKSMKSMVNFLRDFIFEPISEGSDRYVLKTRVGKFYLREIYDDQIKNEGEICELLGVEEASKAALANYLTLLMEYVKITRSPKLEIDTRFGTMSFDNSNFISDVKRMAKDYCETIYGDENSDVSKNSKLPKITCFIKLAQALEHYKVLNVDKNGDTCERYLPLLNSNADTAAEYIKIFENDNPTILWKNKSTPIPEYILNKISSLNLTDLSDFIENTPIVSAYIERNKKLISDADREFESIFNDRKKKFDEFEKYISSITSDKSKVEECVEVEDVQSESETSVEANVSTEPPTEENKNEADSSANENATNEKSAATDTNTLTPSTSDEKETEDITKASVPQKSEAVESNPTNPPPTRRARQPRKKSTDTSEAEQRLSELLGL